MKHWKTWLIAMSAALAGAAATHVAWLFREAARGPRAVERAACEPSDEHLGRQEGRFEGALHALERAKPAGIEQAVAARAAAPAPAPPATFGRAGLPSMPPPTFEQRKTMLRHSYGALFRELILSPLETERMLQVLSEQQARRSPAESGREGAEIAAAIGVDKAAAFERLRGTMSARFELRSVRDQLEDAGEPMTAEQYRALMTAIRAQSPQLPTSPPRGETLEDSMELFRDWMSERNEAFRETAATILNPAQLKMLDESLALREAMQSQLGAALGSAPAGSGG
jgi:hypothetical protein